MPLIKTLSLKNLRTQLTLWFGGLLLLTMACVALYVGQIASQEIMRTAGETLAVSTRASAELLATNISEREREIELLRQGFEETDDISSQNARKTLERVQALKSGYAWIGLTDAQGNIIQATNGMLIGNNARERPWFKGAFDGLFMGDLHLAVLLAKLLPELADNQPMRFIDIAVPVQSDEGQVAGILAAHLHWTWVTDVVRSILSDDKTLQDAELLIVDREGAVLYPEKLVSGQGLPRELNPAMTYQSLTWPDGQAYLTSVASVGASTRIDLGWRVIMRQPLDVTTEPVRDLQVKLLSLGVLAFLVVMLIAYRISSRLTRPIENLVQVARTIEQAPRHARFPTEAGSPELTTLAHALESMTTSLLNRERDLETLNASLETQVESRTDELRQANQRLQTLAHTDSLTGLLNRRHLEERLQDIHQQFLSTHRPYSLLMFDVDHFKAINDRFGHQAGDQVLQSLGKIILNATRASDVCARYGGEEFIMMIPERTNPQDGKELAERIRSLIEGYEFPEVGRVTVSIGIAQARPDDTSPQTVIARADAALYQAKASGRNRVVQVTD